MGVTFRITEPFPFDVAGCALRDAPALRAAGAVGPLALAAVLAFSCGCGDEERAGATSATSAGASAISLGPPPIRPATTAAGITAIEIDGRPAIFTTSAEALRAVAARLTTAIEDAHASLAALSPAEAVAWQNDLLGLAARARAAPVSDGALTSLAAAAERGALDLAPDPAAGTPFVCEGAPPLLAQLLPPADGWRENGTEMPVLSHERAFGLRRVFRLFARQDLRALASQLVVVDREGTARTSCVAGEIELLELGGDGAVSARIWELDRVALARGAEHALREVDRVSHVPDLGADSFFLDERSVILLAEVPCRRCHDDAFEMSLPLPGLAPTPRIAALLTQFPAPWPSAGSER